MRCVLILLVLSAAVIAQVNDARIAREFESLMRQASAAKESDPNAARAASDAWKRSLDGFISSWKAESATLKEGRWPLARALLLAGMPGEAAPLLEAFCAAHGDHEDLEDAWLTHASARLENGEPKKAHEVLSAFLASRPESTRRLPARFYFGIACLGTFDDKEAIAAFDQVIKEGGNHPLVADANLKVMTTLAENGRAAEALIRLVSLLKEHPDAPALLALKEQLEAIGKAPPSSSENVTWVRGKGSLTATPGRVTVIVFFADFYETSIDELKRIQAASAAWRGKPVDVVAVTKRYRGKSTTAEDEATRLGLLADRLALTFPIGMFGSDVTLRAFNVRGLPHTLVVGVDGKVALLKVGAAKRELRSDRVLQATIDRALSAPR